jgi:RHS repeat-associated protein
MLENGTSSFYHYDALGSTHQLTDSSQTVTDTYRYNGWGETVARTGTTKNPHTYVGKERYYGVPDALLYLLGLRLYSSRSGHFVSLDPARLDTSWYAYCQNAVTLHSDPLGLWDMFEVHQDQTIAWATTLFVVRGGGVIVPTTAEKHAMGIASGQVDVDRGMVWPPYSDVNWGWHFDHPPGSGVRQMLFEDQMRTAIRLGKIRRQCVESAKALGTGLHPLQDSFAHGPATPWEHGVIRWGVGWIGILGNARHIDNWRSDTDWGRPSRIWTCPPQDRWWNEGKYFGREFHWVRGSSRLEKTRTATIAAIRRWLDATCCGERVD